MCTGAMLNYPGGSVLGRNMDVEGPVPFNLIYQPRGYDCVDNLLEGSHKAKYRILGIGFHNRDPLKDGVNEHGLIGITNEFAGTNLFAQTTDPGKINVSSYHFLTFALANYRTVDELVADLPRIHFSTHNHQGEKVISPMFHYMFVDESQRCIVIEPKDEQLVYYENPYGVMTNAPDFEKHIKKLSQLIDLDQPEKFKGAKKLPGGYDPSSRFIRAFYLTRMSLPAEDNGQALASLYNVLGAVALPKGFIPNQRYHDYTFTTYTCAYDTQTRQLSLHTEKNPNLISLKLEEIPNPDQRQAFYVDENFEIESILVKSNHEGKLEA